MAREQLHPNEAALVRALARCDLFAGLAHADLRLVARITVPRSLRKGEYLFHEGAPVQGFYVVESGAINVHRVSPSGKEHVLHIFRAGESFAEAALIGQKGYPASARAERAARVLLVDKDGFLALLRRKPDFAIRLILAISQRLRVLVERLDDLTLKTVETRFAQWLLRRCPPDAPVRQVQIELDVTKQALAAELGTVGETLSRVLAKFRAEHLLEVRGKTLTVLNPARLNALLRHNYVD
ncbi:MAG: Crp/Fnr family transcriptional regulator [Verrucomicrobiae bacterium]|nr:Crp/Fnr family transcriptional regulator [Verrucomicrobiae bacterium]MCX7722186.1 Crp/Fnr family transcriptional regulator [Verrucomicrobiae bacterium]MDW7980682.1 Crp/Fnr family transcriptional regulator [Verrucomicrobiales bacterium]